MNLTPIVLYNNTLSATPASFQQMLTIPANASINSTYTNIRFRDGNYKLLTSWLESYTTSSATIWVVLPDGIPSKSAITIYMETGSLSDNFLDGVTVGEAPQLSATYGQYDNGAKVFDFYENFVGTSLPSGWNSGAVSGSSVTVNNGLTISGNGVTAGSTYAATNNVVFTNNEILEAYINQNDAVTLGERGMIGISTVNNAEPLWDNVGGAGDTIAGWSAGKNGIASVIQSETVLDGSTAYLNSISSNSNWNIYSVALSSANGVTTFVNYGSVSPASSTTSDNPSAPLYVNTGVYNTGSGSSFDLQYAWLRVRAYPPSGTMPLQVNKTGSIINIAEGLII